MIIHVLEQCDCGTHVLAATTDNTTNNNGITEDYNARLQQSIETVNAFQTNTFDPEIFHLTENATHIPCLVHVIQLSVKALLDSVRVTAQNNDTTAQWDDKVDSALSTTSQDLPFTLEKVCVLSIIQIDYIVTNI